MMKTQTITTIIAVATAALTGAIQAEDGKPPRDRKPPKHILEKFDKDGDGKLNKEERAAAREDMKEHRDKMKKKMLDRFDTDKDGKLSKEERKAAQETIAKERAEIKKAVLAKFDKNSNGKIDEDEREGVREWVKENYPDAMPPRPHRARKGKGPRGEKGKGQGRKKRGEE